MQAVPAAVLPLRDEASIKQFLLDPAARGAILASLGGDMRVIQGARALPGVLSDRVMVCLMYSWCPELGLRACSSCEETLPGRWEIVMCG